MATIKNNLKATVASRISDKSVDYSIAKTDVGNTFDDTIDYLSATEANVDLYYDKGLFVYKTDPYGVVQYYVSILDDVSGDVSVATNWAKLAIGNAGLISNFVQIYSVGNNADYPNEDKYFDYELTLADENGKYFYMQIGGDQRTTSDVLAYNIALDLTNANDGDCVIFDMDTYGSGQSILSITGDFTEYLSNKATYLVTYSTVPINGKNYTVRQISENGFTAKSQISPLVGTGKVLVTGANKTVTLPLAAYGNEGKEVKIIVQGAGEVTTINAWDGGDSVDFGGRTVLPLTTGSLTFVSNGTSTWILT